MDPKEDFDFPFPLFRGLFRDSSDTLFQRPGIPRPPKPSAFTNETCVVREPKEKISFDLPSPLPFPGQLTEKNLVPPRPNEPYLFPFVTLSRNLWLNFGMQWTKNSRARLSQFRYEIKVRGGPGRA